MLNSKNNKIKYKNKINHSIGDIWGIKKYLRIKIILAWQTNVMGFN